jgi:CRP-like cAMP-binding protein
MAYLVPGDFCDLHIAILGEMDHSIGTLSDCEVVDIPRATVIAMTNRVPLARALWWATLVDEAVLREWLVNIGTRDAKKAIAHLLCEMLFRLRAVGLVAQGDSFDLPITQEELGNTVGLSTVHVNRTLHDLRNNGLITFEHKRLTVLKVDRLIEISGFNPNYLHLAAK